MVASELIMLANVWPFRIWVEAIRSTALGILLYKVVGGHPLLRHITRNKYMSAHSLIKRGQIIDCTLVSVFP